MHTLLAVLQFDLKSLFTAHRIRHIAVYYTLLSTITIVVAWPTSYSIEGAVPPSTFVWWAFINTYLLGHAVLTSSAHTALRNDDIVPRDWVQYSRVAPVTILLGKLVSGIAVAGVWLLLSLPFALTARLTVPGHIPFLPLYLFWFGLAAALAVWGTWFSMILKQREQRNWLVHGAWLLILLLPLSFRTPWYNFSPIAVVQSLLRELPLPPHAASGLIAGSNLITVAAIAATGCVFTLLEARRWQRKSQVMPRDGV